MNSTVYLDKCTFMENYQTGGGTIGIMTSILRVANTSFTHNARSDIYYYQSEVYFNTKIKTYMCFFKYDNISLKSNVKLFGQAAVRENIIGNQHIPLQVDTAVQETPYASSKMFIYLP